MTIRHSKLEDIPVMQLIFADAKAKMRASGNMLQWTDGYPSDDVLKNDIERGFSYVVEDEDGQIVATFVLAICDDPTYKHIYEDSCKREQSRAIPDLPQQAGPCSNYAECSRGSTVGQGRWLDDEHPYGTIHRIASREGTHGVMPYVLQWAFGQIDNIRVDTHRDNIPMQHLLLKHGFSYCGIIYLLNGDERLAYQKLSDK